LQILNILRLFEYIMLRRMFGTEREDMMVFGEVAG
jgi:hypothetical protein